MQRYLVMIVCSSLLGCSGGSPSTQTTQPKQEPRSLLVRHTTLYADRSTAKAYIGVPVCFHLEASTYLADAERIMIPASIPGASPIMVIICPNALVPPYPAITVYGASNGLREDGIWRTAYANYYVTVVATRFTVRLPLPPLTPTTLEPP